MQDVTNTVTKSRIKVSNSWTHGNHSESFVNSKSEWWAQYTWNEWKIFLKLDEWMQKLENKALNG